MAQAAAAMQAVVLAELVPETAVADRAAAAGRAEVAGPVAAADPVEVVGPAEAAEQFRRIQSTPRVSSNPEVPVKFNKSSLLSGLIFTFRQRQLPDVSPWISRGGLKWRGTNPITVASQI